MCATLKSIELSGRDTFDTTVELGLIGETVECFEALPSNGGKGGIAASVLESTGTFGLERFRLRCVELDGAPAPEVATEL